MRQIFILLTLSLLSFTTYAQRRLKFDIHYGQEYKAGRSMLNGIIGSDNASIIVDRRSKGDVFIERINNAGSVEATLPLKKLRHNKLDKIFDEGFVTSEGLFIRFSALDKKSNLIHWIIDEYDLSTLAFKRNVSTNSTDFDGNVYMRYFVARESSVRTSPNKAFVLDYSTSFDRDKEENASVSLTIYNESMEKIWTREYDLPYSSKLLVAKSAQIDDHGNAHILFTETLDRGKDKKKSNLKYHVISFLNEGTVVKDNVIDIGSSFITDAGIAVSSGGVLIASGFYSKGGFDSIDGAFSIQMDIATASVLHSSKTEFDLEFIQQGMTERQKRKSDKKEEKGIEQEMPNFDMDKLIATSDGGWMLLAEEFFITERTYTTTSSNGGVSTRTVTVYHYNDVIVIKIDASGNIMWKEKIIKAASTSGYIRALSYVYGNCDDILTIIYNSDPLSKDNEVTLVSIHPDGQKTTEKLMDAGRKDIMAFPMYSRSTDNCEILLYSGKKKTYQFNRVNFH
jgi:protein involved in ribonucleotide reduction